MQSQLERRSFVDKNEGELREIPQINAISKKLAAKRTKNVPIYLRYEDELKRKNANQAQLRHQLDLARQADEDEMSFKPKTNCSKTMELKSSFVAESLEGHVNIQQQKLARLKMYYLMEEAKDLTFKPHINPRSERMVRPQDKTYIYDRMMSYHISKQEKLRHLDIEIANQSATFKPDLSKSRRSLSATRRSYNADYPHLSKSRDKQKPRIEKMKVLLKQTSVNRKSAVRSPVKTVTEKKKILLVHKDPVNIKGDKKKWHRYDADDIEAGEDNLAVDYSRIKLVPNISGSSLNKKVDDGYKCSKDKTSNLKSSIYNSRKKSRNEFLLSQEISNQELEDAQLLYYKQMMKPGYK